MVYLRARHYAPDMGRFLTRDTWGGDENQPITLNKWVYANANPIVYIDPTGMFSVRMYDRDAATKYAVKYAVNRNGWYRDFGENDCTNFVSQALHAGGYPQDDLWYSTIRGGTAWAETDKFFGYFVGLKRASYTLVSGSIAPRAPAGTDEANLQGQYQTRFSAWKNNPDNRVIPSPFQLENYGQFDLTGLGIRRGDVVLYHQLHSPHVGGGGLFNHAAFIIDIGALTNRFNKTVVPSHISPLIAEHSGGYESNFGGKSPNNNIHSINDTWSEVQAMIIIRIPELILTDDCAN